MAINAIHKTKLPMAINAIQNLQTNLITPTEFSFGELYNDLPEKKCYCIKEKK